MPQPLTTFFAWLLLVLIAGTVSCVSKSFLPEDKYRIEEVVFDRSGSWGMRYGYKVVLRKDGAALYLGDTQAKPPGEQRGEIMPGQFKRLAESVADSDFFSLEGPIHGCTDTEVRTTTVVYAGGTKAIKNHCQGMHPKLDQLEQTIIALVEQIEWKENDN